MRVDFGPTLAELACQEVVDRLGGDTAVADCGGQQMRANDVAAGEMLRILLDLIDWVDCDAAASAVEARKPSAKSAIWPIAETIMSHSISNSLSGIGCGACPSSCTCRGAARAPGPFRP